MQPWTARKQLMPGNPYRTHQFSRKPPRKTRRSRNANYPLSLHSIAAETPAIPLQFFSSLTVPLFKLALKAAPPPVLRFHTLEGENASQKSVDSAGRFTNRSNANTGPSRNCHRPTHKQPSHAFRQELSGVPHEPRPFPSDHSCQSFQQGISQISVRKNAVGRQFSVRPFPQVNSYILLVFEMSS